MTNWFKKTLPVDEKVDWEKRKIEIEAKTRELSKTIPSEQKVAAIIQLADTTGVTVNELLMGLYSYVEFSHVTSPETTTKKHVQYFIKMSEQFNKDLLKLIK